MSKLLSLFHPSPIPCPPSPPHFLTQARGTKKSCRQGKFFLYIHVHVHRYFTYITTLSRQHTILISAFPSLASNPQLVSSIPLSTFTQQHTLYHRQIPLPSLFVHTLTLVFATIHTLPSVIIGFSIRAPLLLSF